jgi:hypothetical protein
MFRFFGDLGKDLLGNTIQDSLGHHGSVWLPSAAVSTSAILIHPYCVLEG